MTPKTKETRMKKSPDTTPTDPVALARSEVERLNAQELKFAMLHLQRSTELEQMRGQRGRQVLTANDPLAVVHDVNSQIRRAEDELAALGEAAGEAHKARVLAIPAVFLAEAEDRERQADKLDAEASELETESRRLRKLLEAHDDWGYVAAEGRVNGEYFRVVPRNDGGPFRVVEAWGPRHERLRANARALRAQAMESRRSEPHAAGMLEADSIDELLAGVFSDPMRLAPPVAAIIEWAEQARGNELRRRTARLSSSGAVPADAPMRFRLQWRRSTIDLAESSAFMPAAEEPIEELEVFVPAASEPLEELA
jgi:hypothetical protein